MADFEENTLKQETPDRELEDVKKSLEAYRHILLPLTRVLEWEQKHYPAILVAVVTLLFAIIWYLEPSVLTLFSMIGVIVCMIDFAVPIVAANVFASKSWTVVEERSYENICIRILNAKIHCSNFKESLRKMKAEKPRLYLLIMMGVFATLAWIGSLIDNLFLTYLMVVFALLVPGLRKHGLLQQAKKTVLDLASRVLKKGKTATATKRD